jgi:hypothetical protein
MDTSEKLVFEYLNHHGYTDIVYEPDGNIPPDFLVNGRIAIEVRRLNQNYCEGNNTQGLEEAAIPLWKKIEKLALSMGPPEDGESWFVFYRFSRPVEQWKKLEPKLRGALQNFKDKSPRVKTSLNFQNGFEVEIFRASKLHVTFYVMAGHSDQESGGWLIPEMEKNLQICISEKTYKIKKMKSKYQEWWLVLSDHIGYSLDDFDRQQFRDIVSIEHDWQKIILINPMDYKEAFEI